MGGIELDPAGDLSPTRWAGTASTPIADIAIGTARIPIGPVPDNNSDIEWLRRTRWLSASERKSRIASRA